MNLLLKKTILIFLSFCCSQGNHSSPNHTQFIMDFVTECELQSVLVITQSYQNGSDNCSKSYNNCLTSEIFGLSQLVKHINNLSIMIAVVDYPPLR